MYWKENTYVLNQKRYSVYMPRLACNLLITNQLKKGFYYIENRKPLVVEHTRLELVTFRLPV